MSILHKDSHISGKLLKGGTVGTLELGRQGTQPRNTCQYSQKCQDSQREIPSLPVVSVRHSPGVCSLAGWKACIPIPVPTIIKSNYLPLQIFTTRYVYAIDNKHQEPVTQLLDKLKKQPWPDDIIRQLWATWSNIPSGSSYLSCSRSMYWIRFTCTRWSHHISIFCSSSGCPLKWTGVASCCWHSCSVSRSTVSGITRFSCCGLCVGSLCTSFLVNLLIPQEGAEETNYEEPSS